MDRLQAAASEATREKLPCASPWSDRGFRAWPPATCFDVATPSRSFEAGAWIGGHVHPLSILDIRGWTAASSSTTSARARGSRGCAPRFDVSAATGVPADAARRPTLLALPASCLRARTPSSRSAPRLGALELPPAARSPRRRGADLPHEPAAGARGAGGAGRLRRPRGLADERLLRLWEFYLRYCEGGVSARHFGLLQIVLDKLQCRLPAGGHALAGTTASR
jgi:hypothetical protein